MLAIPTTALYKEDIFVNDKRSDSDIAWRKQFGDRLKRLIHINGMTQGEFARKLGVTEATLSRYITGTHEPSMSKAERIAEILDCDIGLLFDKTF
jgi:DNA-binding XRE family transcriptional regulator